MAIIESESLFIAMWILFVAIVLFNTLVLVLALPKRRETGVNKLMITITMGSNYFVAAFLVIILAMDSGKNDFGKKEKMRFQLLCNLAGYFGTASLQITLWSMLIAALNLLLGLLFPRKFKRGKNYVVIVRTVVLGELVLLLPMCAIPFLPISQFTAAQQSTWDTLCLPIHSSNEPMWGYSAIWFLISTGVVATLIITFGCLICYLKRQKQEAANAIPMQARLIRKKSSQVKRMSCLMMSIALCWIPALSVCTVTFAGHFISTSTLQWVFGFVLPLGAAVGPLCYIINTGLSGSTMENFVNVCCTKAEKQGNSLRVRMGQLRGDSSTRPTANKPDQTDSQNMKGQNKLVFKQNGASKGHRSISGHSLALRSGRSKNGNCARAKNAPRGATLVQTVALSGRNLMETYGVVEWQATNGSPRKGLLKLFMKGHFQQWKNESNVLSKLNTLERHPNIVDYLWHSKSSHTRLDRGTHEHSHLRRRTTVERYICTSYYHHGTLRDFLINYSVRLQDCYIHAIATQIASGLAFLHSNSIVHNFLESTNVLIGGHPENMTLKAVISNFTEAYDMTCNDAPKTPVTPDPTRNLVTSNKPEDISTNWVEKLSTSVARSTIHDRVLPGVSEDQMCASDVRSFALIMMEMMTWHRQMDLVAKKRALEMDLRHAQNGGGVSMVDDVQVCMDDDSQSHPSPVPFLRSINKDPRRPRSRRDRSLRREQQQHVNTVCESLPEEEFESYDCNTFPRRNSVKNKSNGPQNNAQTGSDLIRIIHQKQDSTCSNDSGVSSQPSSTAMSLHSGSSGCSDRDRSPRFQNRLAKGDRLGNVEFDATTEMWVENHAEELNGFRPCVMEHGMQSTPNISEINTDFREPTTSEEQTAYSLDNLDQEDPTMLPRSSSSLSQFYVRRRSPRPHSFSVERSTATLPNNSNRQEIDLLTARDNVNATLRPKSCFNSSDILEEDSRQRSLTPTPSLPLQRYPGSAIQHLPGLIIPPRRSETPPPEKQFATIRRTCSRKRSSTTIPFSLNQQQQMNIITNPKHHASYPNQISYPYNIQVNSETISRPREDAPVLKHQTPHWDCSCPSAIGEQHLGYCQELQALFPHQLCPDGSMLQQEVECGRAMAKWMVPLSKINGYLPKQLVQVMEVCWSEEPAPPSTAVHRMLDNCLTEVAL